MAKIDDIGSELDKLDILRKATIKQTVRDFGQPYRDRHPICLQLWQNDVTIRLDVEDSYRSNTIKRKDALDMAHWLIEMLE